MNKELKKINDRLEIIEKNTHSEYDLTFGQYLLSLGVILIGFIIALIFIYTLIAIFCRVIVYSDTITPNILPNMEHQFEDCGIAYEIDITKP